MSDIKIDPIKRLIGEIRLKGDKSISHRAVMMGAISEGKTVVGNFLNSEDCMSTVSAFRQLGVSMEFFGDKLVIDGGGLNGLRAPDSEIYLGNSGTSMRLISGILAGQDFESTLTGDESLSKRPMRRIIEPLVLMGAVIRPSRGGCAPLAIKGGRLKPIKYKTKIASAQVKSSIIFAALYADGVTEIEEPVKSRDHTERMLGLFGAKMMIDGPRVSVSGKPTLKGVTLTVPGDISSAAFFIIAAIILRGSEILIKDALFNRTRLGLIDILKEMGANIEVRQKHFNGCEEVCDIFVTSGTIRGVLIGRDKIPSVIDELPILMVAAAFACGETRIEGAGELRVKETDRIESMSVALKSMGARIDVDGDNISIAGTGVLKGSEMDSLGDHRTAMSLIVASLAAKGGSTIKNVDCVNTSFPGFFEILASVSKSRQENG